MEAKNLLKAYAKVNLQLDVLGRRADGYHELAGVMQRISICDDICIRVGEGPFDDDPVENIVVRFSEPVPYNNTVRKAARLFLRGERHFVCVEVMKSIPSEAGLGGASADAAAVLEGLNALFKGTGLERSREELSAIGLAVGADVPFCLAGGCAAARGVGELLAPLPLLELDLLVVKGKRGVSTARLFALIDEDGGALRSGSRLPENALCEMEKAIRANDKATVGRCMINALQPSAERIVPEIAEQVRRMRLYGALGACMTGSGAAVIGLFENAEKAARAKALFADCEFAEVCRSQG